MVLAGSGNGNGNGKDKKDEDWLTPVLMNWLPEIGIDLTDINSIVARASPRLIEDTRQSLDPQTDNGYRKGLLNGLVVKRTQRNDIDWNIRMEKREKEIEPELITMAKHLENNNLIVDGNKVSQDNLCKAIRIATAMNEIFQ